MSLFEENTPVSQTAAEDNVADHLLEHGSFLLDQWIESCTRGGKVSRNTYAVGIVVLNHLKKRFPVMRSDVISEGGEIRGSRSSGFRRTLEAYGISPRYLKEVTTRQAHQDGQRLLDLVAEDETIRKIPHDVRIRLLVTLIGRLAGNAIQWLNRPSLDLDVERGVAPSTWIQEILERAKGISGGVVEQHLVGAKLARRYSPAGIEIPNHPAHAADLQTERRSDYEIGTTTYHITGTPGEGVIRKCADNIKAGRHPVLLVPRDRQEAAKQLAELQEVDSKISIVSIEDFLAMNIIEIATERKASFYDILEEIIHIYNDRLEAVETDLSLKITVR